MSDRPTPRTDAEADNASLCDQCVPAEFSRQIERELADANEREEKVKTMLLDPATVHINMMRGIIAKLDWPTLEHIHGNHPLRAQRDALLEAFERIKSGTDAPPIDVFGDYQFGLHCGVEDRSCSSRYDGADYGWAQGVERTIEWAANEAEAAIALAKGGGQ